MLDCKDVQADLELHCPHIEGLVQDYSNLILQEMVQKDFYSQFWCQYKYKYKYFAFFI